MLFCILSYCSSLTLYPPKAISFFLLLIDLLPTAYCIFTSKLSTVFFFAHNIAFYRSKVEKTVIPSVPVLKSYYHTIVHFDGRIWFTTLVVVHHWQRSCSVIRTGTSSASSCSLRPRVCTLASSSTVAKKVWPVVCSVCPSLWCWLAWGKAVVM